MADCLYCHRHKGKRQCPALGGLICPVCCGTHRGRAIACPTDCIYYRPGEHYQQARSGHQLLKIRQPLYDALLQQHGERGLVVVNLLDFACFSYAVRQPGVSDQELLAGLEGVRAKLSPLTIAQVATSACTEHLWGVVEAWLKEQQLDRELVREVLDRVVAAGREFSGEGLVSRIYVQALVGFIEERFPEQASHLRAEQRPAGQIDNRTDSRIVNPAEALRGR